MFYLNDHIKSLNNRTGVCITLITIKKQYRTDRNMAYGIFVIQSTDFFNNTILLTPNSKPLSVIFSECYPGFRNIWYSNLISDIESISRNHCEHVFFTKNNNNNTLMILNSVGFKRGTTVSIRNSIVNQFTGRITITTLQTKHPPLC